ncbi:MAG: hypothetical protein CM15mP65_22050 [Crocinitomicaceae bacterium]|nr:MAG: hypothetical protein CM15mP65_22050 [Crocinitomicaceae bacterium]
MNAAGDRIVVGAYPQIEPLHILGMALVGYETLFCMEVTTSVGM